MSPVPIKLPRKAFITGGADGIGRNIVKAFCNSQYQVAFCDKNEDLGKMCIRDRGKFLENIKGKLCADKGYIGQVLFENLFLNGIQPVSYTHLDVYKRQNLIR